MRNLEEQLHVVFGFTDALQIRASDRRSPDIARGRPAIQQKRLNRMTCFPDFASFNHFCDLIPRRGVRPLQRPSVS